MELWKELDLWSEEEWECHGDSVKYKKKLKTERVFEFLASLNAKLNDVRGRILRKCPLSSIREVFLEVRQKGNKQKVTLKNIETLITLVSKN